MIRIRDDTNRCANCKIREECRDAQGVVQWRHCPYFQPDFDLLAKQKQKGRQRL